jgi:hypothetical protein
VAHLGHRTMARLIYVAKMPHMHSAAPSSRNSAARARSSWVQTPESGDTWQECMARPASENRDPQTYDCPVAALCVWQKLSGRTQLCPPREALKRGFDPRVTLFDFPAQLELDLKNKETCEG